MIKILMHARFFHLPLYNNTCVLFNIDMCMREKISNSKIPVHTQMVLGAFTPAQLYFSSILIFLSTGHAHWRESFTYSNNPRRCHRKTNPLWSDFFFWLSYHDVACWLVYGTTSDLWRRNNKKKMIKRKRSGRNNNILMPRIFTYRICCCVAVCSIVWCVEFLISSLG